MGSAKKYRSLTPCPRELRKPKEESRRPMSATVPRGPAGGQEASEFAILPKQGVHRMVIWFKALHPVWQALVATTFTWLVTALGAGLVFFFKSINRRVLDGMLGFAAGVMIAASYWSLLAPAIEMAELAGMRPWIPAAGGFLAGGLFLWGV